MERASSAGSIPGRTDAAINMAGGFRGEDTG
jgi:hypothetical protein